MKKFYFENILALLYFLTFLKHHVVWSFQVKKFFLKRSESTSAISEFVYRSVVE